jgi:hypothetical protein
MHVDMVLPADMAAHVSLLGEGGVRDSKKEFCTNCMCCLSERHSPCGPVPCQSGGRYHYTPTRACNRACCAPGVARWLAADLFCNKQQKPRRIRKEVGRGSL